MNSFTEFPANDATAFLSQVEFFAGIQPELLSRITQGVQTRKLRTGQEICSVGERQSQIFFVVTGLIKRSLVAENGHESVAELIAPGQPFGDTEFFSRQPFAINAVAVEPTQLLCLDGDAVRASAETDAWFGSRVISLMAAGRFRSESERAVAPTRSSSERVLDYLIDLAEKNRAAGWGSTVKLVTTKQLIAARIGLTPETFSRALRQLSVEGKILVDRRHVTLRETGTTTSRNTAIDEPIAHRCLCNVQTDTVSAHMTDRTGKSSPLRNPAAAAGCRPSLQTINIAGRQRMLSQRMSKFWLMIRHGITVRHARTRLRQTMAEFEQQMAHLGNLDGGQDIAQSLRVLADAWRPFRLQLTQAGPDQGELVLSLSDEVLRAANELTLACVRFVDDDRAHFVNLAGRQRMLLQHIAKLYLLKCSGASTASSTAQIETAGQEFVAAMRKLLASSENQPVLRKQLHLVYSQWLAMTTKLGSVADRDAAYAASQVSLVSERVVRQMDNVVDFYSALKQAA